MSSRPSNNFVIDADFIATRSGQRSLVRGRVQSRPRGSRTAGTHASFGLILENLDGFKTPPANFVMRGVPHTLGMQVSLQP